VLDFRNFLNTLDLSLLHAIPIECDIEYSKDDPGKTVERVSNAMEYIRSMINSDN